MSASQSRTLLVFGSGPGIGNHVAAEFASHGFTHIILAARNQQRLQESAAFIKSKSPSPDSVQIDTIQVNLADLESLPSVIKNIEKLTEKVDVIFYNAARLYDGKGLETSYQDIDEDLKITTLALHIISQWAIPHLQKMAASDPTATAKPSLLVTNSHLPWDPVPALLSLSLTKAAQANLVTSYYRAYKDAGIHIGLVRVQGVVADEKKRLNAKNIGEETWGFYERSEELDLNIVEPEN